VVVAEARGDLARAVAAVGIDDDPFVGEVHRPEAGLDVMRFVAGDEDDREVQWAGGRASKQAIVGRA
jgi:hypothetical protein